MSVSPKAPVALIVLDGFGYSDRTQHNAIANAKAPVWQALWEKGPKTLISTSGLEVGLPEGQMGNSEVGHMTLGAGRVIYQSFTRINKAIQDGDFFENPTYTAAIDKAVQTDKAVHVIGLLSPGGVHAHEDHIIAMMKLARKRGAQKCYLHAFLDGRDTPPRSAESSLKKLEDALVEQGGGTVASVIGRFYALDRDNRWDRTQAAYDLLTRGLGEHVADTALDALRAAYERGEDDEFVKATAIVADGGQPVTMADGDAVVFMNFRPDRARQLSNALVNPEFDGFERAARPTLALVMTTEYSAELNEFASCAYPPEDVRNSFGETLQSAGKTQLRIAETEKYAHVTFFFSGGREELYQGEERILVPSPKVATYDEQPEMSAPEVTEKLVAAIRSGKFDAIVCNYANCDQVGHTGNYEAAIAAVEAVDECLGQVLAAMREVGGEVLITADHGNVEQMYDEHNAQPHTQHTTLPVPLAYVGPRALTLREQGSLADIAPSLLELMGIAKPAEMTGESLIEFAATE